MKLPQKLGTIRVAHSRADSFANVAVGIQYLLQGEGEVESQTSPLMPAGQLSAPVANAADALSTASHKASTCPSGLNTTDDAMLCQ